MPCSMTGFARQEVQHEWGTLACEIRSVNHRYLEPSFRLPEPLRSTEPLLREALRKKLSRGKVEISLFFKTDHSSDTQLALNETLAWRIRDLAQTIQNGLESPAKLGAMDILKWPGVIVSGEIDSDALEKSTSALFLQTMDLLIDNRRREGEELGNMISQRLAAIGDIVTKVKERIPEILEAQQQKLRAKIESLKVDVDEERYSQEVVYLAQKSDVAEELDRLEAHIAEVHHTLKQGGPIGRRLDFLMQELNREANTLSSKSLASDTTQYAVDIKVLIEQMREQVQNIE